MIHIYVYGKCILKAICNCLKKIIHKLALDLISILFYSSLTLEPTTLRGWEDIAAFKSEMAAIGSPIDLEEDTAIAASQSTHDSDDDLWDEQEIYYKGFTSSSNNSFNQDDE